MPLFSHQIATSIRIDAEPAIVRKTMLDFESYPEWSTAFIRSIDVTASKAVPSEAHDNAQDGPSVGSTLKVVLPAATFTPAVTSNTPTEFSWCGSLPGVFTGTHKFVFKAAGSNGELTDFFQGEDFSGLLVPLFTYTSMVTSTEEGFKAYNEQLKQRCEQVAARVF